MRYKQDLSNYKHTNNRHNNRRNSFKGFRKRKTSLFACTILIILLVLCLGTYYVIKVKLIDKDEINIAQEPRGTTIDSSEQYMTDNSRGFNTDNTVDSKQDTVYNTQEDSLGQVTKSADGNDTTTEINQTLEEGQAGSTNPISIEVDEIDQSVEITETQDESSEEVFKPNHVDKRIPVKVKGIYVTGPKAGSDGMQDLIKLVDTTELNAMVIDIKNDLGNVTYNMDLKTVQKIGADCNYIKDIKQLVSELKDKDIYLIARIVSFKDPILAEEKPELSLKNKDGTVFRDKDGLCWVNPYKKEVWKYLVSIAEEAASLGFDEIQFDYIRFSTDTGMNNVDFGKEAKNKSKIKIITEFTKYVTEQLKPLGVYVSADVYGAIIDSKTDAAIVGQSYVDMSKYLDYICPMIYPSHYADGAYGINHPDLEPYNLILKSLKASVTVLKKIDSNKNKAIVRPWLQDFTATWLTNHKSYGAEEIRAQIKALYDAGYEEWILWNGSNKYTKKGLNKK